MSHFTNIKTRFQNLVYLERALSKLNINHKRLITSDQLDNFNSNENILITQPNGHNIEFCWNGLEYELVVDMSFWQQNYPIENFLDKIAQEYAGQVIINESQKIGFQPVFHKSNIDSSNMLVLERWSEN